MRKSIVAAAGAGGFLFLAVMATAPARPAAAGAGQPKKILLTPAAATLRVGDTLTFSAEAVDGSGNPVSGVSFRWSSTRGSVVAVTASGQATANRVGTASVQARGRGLVGKAAVAVVGDEVRGGGEYVAAGQNQVNHVLVDDDWVYWTEVSTKITRVRKSRRAGGAIFDLASEPGKDKRGVSVAYVHLREEGDTLYFSRLTVGFFRHWSIRAVPKDGGRSTLILREDASIDPMFASGWLVAGKYVVVALFFPQALGLPASTRIAAFDTDTRDWIPLITGRFVRGKTFLLAARNNTVFVRAQNENGRTEVLRLNPADGSDTFETLLSQDGADQDLAEPGAVDGNNVYFWSRRGAGRDILFSLPDGGGSTTQLHSGDFGPGLIVDGGQLFWTRDTYNGDGVRRANNAVVRMSITGGALSTVREGVFRTSALAGLGHDGTGLFLVQRERNRKFTIFRTTP